MTECLLSPPGHGTLQQDADHALAERKAFQEARNCVHALFPEAYSTCSATDDALFLTTGTAWVERRALHLVGCHAIKIRKMGHCIVDVETTNYVFGGCVIILTVNPQSSG